MSEIKEEIKLPQKEYNNSLTEFALGWRNQINQISQIDTAEQSLRGFLITQNRILLARMYIEYGIIQTLIDQPVDDAFREALEISSEELDEKDIQELQQFLVENSILEEYKQTAKWGRLFGGGGLIINTDQDPTKPFDIEQVNEKTKLEFYSADRWELNYQASGMLGLDNVNNMKPLSDTPYNYYGQIIHDTRVLRVVGKEAPAPFNYQLMGWGMSEVERVLRSLNSYIKYQYVIFELLDEAKININRVEGFNTSLAQQKTTDAIIRRFQIAAELKNVHNEIVMDKLDEYDQKQISFAGLPDINKENKQNIAADLKMPLTKLFGISSAGFNSGEDDLENYNSMVESEIRGTKHRENIMILLKICCKKLFGFIPEDLSFDFKPLRILTSEQLENVKNAQFARLIEAAREGRISEEEFNEACNKAGLLPIEVGKIV